jgi:predicted RNA-binding Zn ribbon-like protein
MVTPALATSPDVELVLSFLNTVDHDAGTDALATSEGLSAWLAEQRVSAPHDSSRGQLDLAVALRDALRDELAANHDGEVDPPARRRLAQLAEAVPLRVEPADDGTVRLVPVDPTNAVILLLGRVLAAVVVASADGTWSRLKICPADDCRWAFYDQSRNRSRRWCSMEVCGNRSKTRAHRAKRRHDSDPESLPRH